MTETHCPRCLLVTGGAGFIGVNFIRHVLARCPEARVVNVDALTYAGSTSSLRGIDGQHPGRHHFVHADIRDRAAMARVMDEHQPDTLVNFAAESHVDRSIDSPLTFIETNILGVAVLLEEARRLWQKGNPVRFHQVSTDEVFGSLDGDGYFTEATPYDPSSPYSASKAGADHLVRAWHRTFGLPVTISNCSNNYGPWQFPEKLIPLMIANALAGKPLPVYGAGHNVRDWLHVEDHAEAIWTILTRGGEGRCYAVGGGNEWSNIELVRLLAAILDEEQPRQAGSYAGLICHVPDRPGHDLRYAIDCSLVARELGWRPKHDFRDGLRRTVRWYCDNQDWVAAIRAEKYDGSRLGLG